MLSKIVEEENNREYLESPYEELEQDLPKNTKNDIYSRGLRHKAQLEKKIEYEKQKIEEKVQKNLTFKPQIAKSNKNRTAMVREKGVKPEDVLIF